MLVRCDIHCAVLESKSKEQEVGACKVLDGFMDFISASHDANQKGVSLHFAMFELPGMNIYSEKFLSGSAAGQLQRVC
jgi:hypothetical protein